MLIIMLTTLVNKYDHNRKLHNIKKEQWIIHSICITLHVNGVHWRVKKKETFLKRSECSLSIAISQVGSSTSLALGEFAGPDETHLQKSFISDTEPKAKS